MKQSAISLVFLFISTFVTAQNLIPYRLGDQWGYAKKGGEVIIEPQYDEAGEFRATITWVKKDGKYAYINEDGKAVTPFEFDEASYFGFGGTTAVQKGDSWGIINNKGEVVMPCQYDSIATHPAASKNNHFFITVLDGQYGYLNNKGQEVVEPKYQRAEFFTPSKIAKVWLDNDFWGYIDEQGREYFQQEPYSTSIKKYREKHIEELLSGDRAPIDKEQAKKLKFFEPDESYRVTATFKRTPDEEPFEMATYSGITKPYIKYGEISFLLNGDSLQLAVYQSLRLRQIPMYRDYLFLPFKDDTNGELTYGGGRYIDIRMSEIKDNKLTIDFNKAYNPYCAYSDGFNCPVPPLENHLEVEVEAGEKKFKM